MSANSLTAGSPNLTLPPTLAAAELLEQEYLTLRGKILEVAATLDRLDRAPGDASADQRLDQLRQCLQIALELSPGRAERIQLLLSDPFEEGWLNRFTPAR